ncbi:MAG: Hsp20/alpha crystallin family protein [Bellilinea sp.]
MITVIFKPRQVRPGYSIVEDPLVYFSGNRNYRPTFQTRAWRPATDIYETEENVIVLVEIAGMNEDGFSISMDRNVLNIQGLRNSPMEDRRAVHQMEIPFGEFSVEIVFPMEVNLHRVTATYSNGFLNIILPKEPPKHIDLTRE